MRYKGDWLGNEILAATGNRRKRKGIQLLRKMMFAATNIPCLIKSIWSGSESR